ncbi:MAG: hypothetical protein BJ554DRAFT_828, partial [Olpidium bornovanus]
MRSAILTKEALSASLRSLSFRRKCLSSTTVPTTTAAAATTTEPMMIAPPFVSTARVMRVCC